MSRSFIVDTTKVVLIDPKRMGKSMLACNLARRTLIEGCMVLFTTAGQLLGDLPVLGNELPPPICECRLDDGFVIFKALLTVPARTVSG